MKNLFVAAAIAGAVCAGSAGPASAQQLYWTASGLYGPSTSRA
jgi:hypothetical protein